MSFINLLFEIKQSQRYYIPLDKEILNIKKVTGCHVWLGAFISVEMW